MRTSLGYANTEIQSQLQKFNKVFRRKSKNFLQIDHFMKQTEGSRMTVGTFDIEYFKPSIKSIQNEQNYNIKIVDTSNQNMFCPDKTNESNYENQKLVLRNKQLQLIIKHQQEMLKQLELYTSSAF